MTSSRLWDRAAQLPVAIDGRLRPELVALPTGLPSLGDLFTFMRDAELRFETLRMRIEDRTWTAEGERLIVIETILRHPRDARVTTSEPARGTAGNYEIWVSDGEVVRTYAAQHRLGTSRPVRPSVVGLEDSDLPGMSAVYRPLTPLPMDTLPEAFVHPAGFCQNVLSTGACRILGSDVVADREAIVIECDHPRGTEVWADLRDHRLQVWVDRETGVIARLRETIGGDVTRDAMVVSLEPNASLPPTAFDFEFPPDATLIY
jgi:outer membrane lipoprotein-sorting protein